MKRQGKKEQLMLPWCWPYSQTFILLPIKLFFWLERLKWHFGPLGIHVSWVFALWCSQYLEFLLPDINITSSLNSSKYLVEWHQVIMPSGIIKEAFPDHSIWNSTSLPFIFCPSPTLFFFLVVFITWKTELFFSYYLSFNKYNRQLVCFAHTTVYLVPWILFVTW